ncbi:MAG: TonB-dependent receptor [Rikenellaceae bacterium]|nr:TonB-dependent receptor [Rikenellaceae bacterium]
MNKIILSVLFSALVGQVWAARQNPATGRVVDAANNPVEFATVVLLNGADQVAGTTTDEEGRFTLTVSPGSYTLSVQHLSYDEYSKQLELTAGIDLGDIVLTQSATKIDEVVVKGQLVRREADRFVVDVANSVAALGKDGVELLERAPGVWINDDKISVNGKSGSKVYVNDRELKMSNEQLITYIKTLRAEEIQKIEIIPTSGADYDADSAGGVIKITLKRQRENGTQGSVQMWSTLNRYGTNLNPSANIALHSGKLDLNAAAWFTDQEAEANATEQTHFFTNESLLESQSKAKEDGQDYGGRLDAVYALAKNHSIGIGGRYTEDWDDNTNNSLSLLRSDSFEERTKSLFLGDTKQRDVNGTFNYVWKIDTLGSTLKLLADYQVRTNGNGHDNHSLKNSIDSLYRDRTDSKYRMASTSLAWEQHFSPKIVLQAGAKYTYYRMQSDALYEYNKEGAWFKNERESFHIDYDEQIAAAYGIVRGNFDRWGFVAGLRGEYTRTESEGTKLGKDYFSLFPNLNLSYKLDKGGKHMLIGQYARKISRPSFWQLNPQRSQISDYSYQTGNPLLDPSYVHDMNLTLVGWYKYTLTVGVNLQTDEIQQNFVSDPNDPNIIYINFINYKDTKQYYVNLNAPLQLTKWWEANANLTYVAWEQRATAESPVKLYHMFMTYCSTTFTLPHKFYIDLSWNYHNRITMGNAVIGAAHQVNGQLKKRFGERFTATFAVHNIFNAQQDISARNEQFDRSYKLDQFWSDRQFRIGLSWNFHSGKAFRQRTLENTGEGRF